MGLGPLIALLKRIEGLVRRYGTMQALCTFQETPKIVVTQEIHIIHGGYPGNIAGNAGNTGKFRHGFPACRKIPAQCRKIPECLSGMPDSSGTVPATCRKNKEEIFPGMSSFRNAGTGFPACRNGFRHAGIFRNVSGTLRGMSLTFFSAHAGNLPECSSGMPETVFGHSGSPFYLTVKYVMKCFYYLVFNINNLVFYFTSNIFDTGK